MTELMKKSKESVNLGNLIRQHQQALDKKLGSKASKKGRTSVAKPSVSASMSQHGGQKSSTGTSKKRSSVAQSAKVKK